jgi:phosphoribosylanthranilate isomerase
LKVKICGITNIEDALLCEKSGADALGFIFCRPSKRYIDPEAARLIIERLSPYTMKIGVFVNETAEFVNYTGSMLKLNAVQLHGEETPEFISGIELPVVKAFRINGAFNYSSLSSYRSSYLMLDSYSSNTFGGTGRRFNWEEIPFSLREKIILSGGVSSENIEYIFSEIKPRAVDLSSSIEKEPGKKDAEKVNEFFNKINSLRR